MDKERDYHFGKQPGSTYFSKRLETGSGTRFRIASRVFDRLEDQHFALERDELVIRVTDGGRQEVIAKFTEDDRGLFLLKFQRWNTHLGRPFKNASFSFLPREIDKILEFLVHLKTVHFPNGQKLKFRDEQLHKLLLETQEEKRQFAANNEDLIVDLATYQVTKKDVKALAYRKKQLVTFTEMLADRAITEPDWQQFFEINQWIFGYGLSYVSFAGLDERKLEQYVQGANLIHPGKEADAVMKTRAAINSLCFVEIKKHTTDLLRESTYRSGTWAPSRELGSGIVQAQMTVHAAVESLRSRVILSRKGSGDPTGEDLLNIEPRAYLVVGSLEQFVTEHGWNEAKCRSFELFRRNIRQPEIITFDELYERAKFIVAADARAPAPRTVSV